MLYPINTYIEKGFITFSIATFLFFINPELYIIRQLYILSLLVFYSLFFIISKRNDGISIQGLIAFFFILYLSTDIFCRIEFEYKKYKLIEVISYTLLLFFNKPLFTKHIKFSISTTLLVIICFNLVFIIKYLFFNYDFIDFINLHFGNSGIYAIFLTLCAILILSNKKYIHPFKYKIIPIITAYIMVIGAITLSSRTSIILFVIYIFFHYVKRKDIQKNKLCFIFLSLFILLILISLTFLYKQDSSIGRLIIWKICLSIIKDHFWVGIGVYNFPRVYPLYQASWYESGALTPNEILIIDNTQIAFNEFIQSFVELGIIGFILFSCIIYTYLYKPNKQRPFCVSLIMSMFFSYTLHSPIIIFLMIIVLSFIKDDTKFKFSNTTNKIILILIVGMTFSMSVFCINKQFSITTIAQLSKHCPSKLDSYYIAHKKYLSDTSNIIRGIALYHHKKNNFCKSNYYLTQINNLIRNNDLELLKALNYKKMNNIKLAEKHFLLSIAICPNRFINRYELFKFYSEQNDREKSIDTALKILHLKEKVVSPKSSAIKDYMLDFVLNIDTSSFPKCLYNKKHIRVAKTPDL